MKGPDRRRRETVGPLSVAEHVTRKPSARDTPNVCIRDMGLFVCEPPQPMAAYLRSPAEKNEAPGIRTLFVFFTLTGLDGWVLTRRTRRRTLHKGRFLSARDTCRTNKDPVSSLLLLSAFPHLSFMRAPDPYTQHSAGGVALKSKSSICNVT